MALFTKTTPTSVSIWIFAAVLLFVAGITFRSEGFGYVPPVLTTTILTIQIVLSSTMLSVGFFLSLVAMCVEESIGRRKAFAWCATGAIIVLAFFIGGGLVVYYGTESFLLRWRMDSTSLPRLVADAQMESCPIKTRLKVCEVYFASTGVSLAYLDNDGHLTKYAPTDAALNGRQEQIILDHQVDQLFELSKDQRKTFLLEIIPVIFIFVCSPLCIAAKSHR